MLEEDQACSGKINNMSDTKFKAVNCNLIQSSEQDTNQTDCLEEYLKGKKVREDKIEPHLHNE